MDKRTLIVGVAVAAAVPLLEALTKFSPDTLVDWRPWVVGVLTACVRHTAVFALAQIAARKAGA